MTEIMLREPEPLNPEPLKPKKRKKKWIIIGAIVAALAIAAALVLPRLLGGGPDGADEILEEEVYVDVASANYFSGVIEPQQTWDIQRDAGREVAQVYVTVGQDVIPGQQLFAYETSELSMQLKQAQLELSGIYNEIDGYGAQISELTAQRDQAGADQQLQYTIQIQEMQTARQQAELNLQMKQMEIENLQKSIDNAVVTSTMEGVVKQINNSGNQDPTLPFMTILATGAYRVKGTVDEMNVWSLYEGMPVTVRSRVDEDRTWTGTITKIDTENTVSTNQDVYYYGGGGSENQASKYYFYVALETDDQLLLGQHVYIEPLYDDLGSPEPTGGAELEGGVQEEELQTEPGE